MNMQHKTLEEFVLSLPGSYALSEKQQDNVTKLTEVSKKFLQRAKIPCPESQSVSANTVVLESGHQPNFLPYPGTWKKAFCLNWIRNTLHHEGHESVSFFGLADQNLSTARILTKNQVPALNKDGFIKIGYKINEQDKFRSFSKVQKPSYEQWESEIKRIEHHYQDITRKTRSETSLLKKQGDTLFEILWSSYDIASNAAEINSFVFAKICYELLAVDAGFFLYSDMHHEQFFLLEAKQLLRNVFRFNEIYNRVIAEKGLDIPPVTPNHIPFWYECECGGKTDLIINDFTAEGTCNLCKKEYHLPFGDDFSHLSRYYHAMDFNAVSRNIAMAHGLGDSLFLSGLGGSLQYGQISCTISEELGFHRPVFFGWRSGDYYLGMAHSAAVHELMKQFGLTLSDFLTPALNKKIATRFRQITDTIQTAESHNNQKELMYWSGILGNAKNQLMFARKLFSSSSSFLDILANQQAASICQFWKEALERAEMQLEQGFHRIHQDILYHPPILSDIPPDDLPAFYNNIRNSEVG